MEDWAGERIDTWHVVEVDAQGTRTTLLDYARELEDAKARAKEICKLANGSSREAVDSDALVERLGGLVERTTAIYVPDVILADSTLVYVSQSPLFLMSVPKSNLYTLRR